MRLLLSRLLALAALAWSGFFLVDAFHRWRFEQIFTMAFGPFIPAKYVEDFRRAADWQAPLLLATLPLALFGCWFALRLLFARSSAR